MSTFALQKLASKKGSPASDDSTRAALQLAADQRAATATERREDSVVHTPGERSQSHLERALNASPRVAVQRKLASVLSSRQTTPQPKNTAQRVEMNEEELLSASNEMKTAQREAMTGGGALDDEELLQGKFKIAQKCGDENSPTSHAVQQKQVQPAAQAKGVAINDDSALEAEADVMGAKALQMKPAPSTHQANPSQPVVQRRTSVGGSTIATPENESDAYIISKKTVPIGEVIERLKKIYDDPGTSIPSPTVPFDAIIGLLREWANAKAPSEVLPGEPESLPLVSTQENTFDTYDQLFWALVSNIRAEASRQAHEKIAFEVLENLKLYKPLLKWILSEINKRIQDVPRDVVERMVRGGYARYLIPDLPPGKIDLVNLIIKNEEDALRRLFLAVNTIHQFALKVDGVSPDRGKIKKELGNRTDKYSPFGPEVENARLKGYAVWASFSGSTADILNVARNLGATQHDIRLLADLAVAYFQFLPTSANSTHTLHEVMLVAHKYFGVPYDPKNPTGTLPYALRPELHPQEAGEPIKAKL